MKAIFKREFRSFFTNVTGWIFMAAFLFLFNLYFFVYNLSYGYAYLSYPLSSVTFIFLIIIPILSMRIISEDRKLKTDQIIYTSPVPVLKVVLGKYISMAAVFSIVMGLICLCPLLLSLYGTVPYAECYTAILGTWLFGILAIAIGLFVSSLTENLVIAAIATFAFLFLGYMMGSICDLISSGGNYLTKVLGCLAISGYLDQFFNGIFDINGIVYYITASALFVFLTCQVIQRHRWKAAVKKIKRGVFSVGLIVVGLAVTVAVNFAFSRLPAKVTDLDITYNDVYSITDETKGFLKGLTDDVTIYVLVSESGKDETVDQTLKLYETGSSHIDVEYIDPASSPQFYAAYTETEPEQNSLIVVCGEQSKVIDYSSLYESSIDYTTYSSQTTGYDGEGQITSAIHYVTSDDLPSVYVITGHGETDLGSKFTDALEKQNVKIETVNLLQCDKIDTDIAGIIINGPSSDFSADDARKVGDYLDAGGKALITTNYEAGEMTNFDALLGTYDIEIEAGIVLEGNTQNYTQYPLYLLPEIQTSEYTADLDSLVIVPNAQSINNTEVRTDELEWTPLFTTSDSAYIKTDIKTMTSFAKEDGDREGTFHVGVSVSEEATGAQVTVIGTNYIFNDNADAMVSGTNLQFFKNIVSTFRDEENKTVSIPVKSYTMNLLTVNQSVAIVCAILLIIALPIALVVVGVVIWLRRRKK